VAVVELVSMWTSAAVRGAGIGRRLVDAVIDWARQTGADRVDLWVTRGNDAAAQLYESIGFEVTGDHQPLPSDPCKDEVRMRLPLRAPDRPTG
jgi:GNAT superfamily N-acetyltransferase